MLKVLNIKLMEIKPTAAKMAKKLKGGEILALIGNLGSGKTTFARALGKALGVKHAITSPTFALMRIFPARLSGRRAAFYHLDLYRAKNFREVKALGITEMWGQKGTLTVIEWADKIKKHLPKKAVAIYFKQ